MRNKRRLIAAAGKEPCEQFCGVTAQPDVFILRDSPGRFRITRRESQLGECSCNGGLINRRPARQLARLPQDVLTHLVENLGQDFLFPGTKSIVVFFRRHAVRPR